MRGSIGVASLLLSISAHAAPSCGPALGALVDARLWLGHRLDAARVSERKSYYLSELESGRLSSGSLPADLDAEARLGLIEALTEYSRLDFWMPDKAWSEMSAAQSRGLRLSLAQLDLRKRLTSARAEDIILKLYEIAHGDPLSWKNIFANGFDASAKRHVVERFEKALAKKGLREAMAEIGLIREEKGVEHGAKWMHEHPVATDNIGVSGFWALAVANHSFALSAPKWQLALRPEDPAVQAIFRKMIEHGTESAKSDIYAYYSSHGLIGVKDRIAFDAGWTIFQREVNFAGALYGSYLTYNGINTLLRLNMGEEIKKRLDQRPDENIENYAQAYFEKSLKQFEASPAGMAALRKYGRNLKPGDSEYETLWAPVQAGLVAARKVPAR